MTSEVQAAVNALEAEMIGKQARDFVKEQEARDRECALVEATFEEGRKEGISDACKAFRERMTYRKEVTGFSDLLISRIVEEVRNGLTTKAKVDMAPEGQNAGRPKETEDALMRHEYLHRTMTQPESVKDLYTKKVRDGLDRQLELPFGKSGVTVTAFTSGMHQPVEIDTATFLVMKGEKDDTL